jgi:hypothetical protein
MVGFGVWRVCCAWAPRKVARFVRPSVDATRWRLLAGAAAAVVFLLFFYSDAVGRPSTTARSSSAAHLPPLRGLATPDESPTSSFYSRVLSDAATDDGVVIFTVVGLPGDGADPSSPPSSPDLARLLDLVRNWDASLQGSFPTEDARSRRLIVGVGPRTCAVLREAGVGGCVEDTVTAGVWPPAAVVDSVAGTAIVRFKYAWTMEALERGYAVLYADVDLTFARGADPLASLLRGWRKRGGARHEGGDGRGAGGMKGEGEGEGPMTTRGGSAHSGADVLGLSDHESPDHTCTDAFRCDLRSVARGSRGSVGSGAGWVGLSDERRAAPERRGRRLACFLTDGGHYPEGSTCVSTAFWVAVPTSPALLFFRAVAAALEASPEEWEQKVFNRVLPDRIMTGEEAGGDDGAGWRVKFRLIDPAAAGNVAAQECARRTSPPLADCPAVEDGDASWDGEGGGGRVALPARLLVHAGYIQGLAGKVSALSSAEGGWV